MQLNNPKVMAKKTNINVGLPSPIELARISAEQEKAEAIASAESKSSVIGHGQQPVISPDVEKLRAMGQRPTRVTRTFTLDQKTEKLLTEAQSRLGLPKSAILETAFTAWWNAVKNNL